MAMAEACAAVLPWRMFAARSSRSLTGGIIVLRHWNHGGTSGGKPDCGSEAETSSRTPTSEFGQVLAKQLHDQIIVILEVAAVDIPTRILAMLQFF
jgi:hypothetical protein